VTRRPYGLQAKLSVGDYLKTEDGQIGDLSDPDPTAGWPQWSRSLLVLLGYAIIERLQHELHTFVQYLKMAESDLAGIEQNAAEFGECETPPIKRN